MGDRPCKRAQLDIKIRNYLTLISTSSLVKIYEFGRQRENLLAEKQAHLRPLKHFFLPLDKYTWRKNN